MAMTVTNQQVLEFYANKLADGATCPRTKDYLEELKKKEIEQLKKSKKADQEIAGMCLHGDYKKVAQVFKAGISADWENKGLNKDKQFYIWMKYHEMFTWLLESTCGLNYEDIFLEKTDYYQVELQKWHLYVSWYAYLESGLYGNGFTLKAKAPNFKCRELLLWMCEAAAGSEVAEKYLKNMGCSGWISKINEEIQEAIKQKTIKATK